VGGANAPEMLEAAKKTLELWRRCGDAAGQARAHIVISAALLGCGDAGPSKDAAAEGEQLCKEASVEGSIRAAAMLASARAAFALGQVQAASRSAKQALVCATAASDLLLKEEALAMVTKIKG